MHAEEYKFIDIGTDDLSHRSSFYIAEKEALKEIDGKTFKGSKRNIKLARESSKRSKRPPSKIL